MSWACLSYQTNYSRSRHHSTRSPTGPKNSSAPVEWPFASVLPTNCFNVGVEMPAGTGRSEVHLVIHTFLPSTCAFRASKVLFGLMFAGKRESFSAGDWSISYTSTLPCLALSREPCILTSVKNIGNAGFPVPIIRSPKVELQTRTVPEGRSFQVRGSLWVAKMDFQENPIHTAL